MPRTKKQNFIFAFIMCVFMCVVMSAYNIIIRSGLSYETMFIWGKNLGPTFIFAFTISYLIVNPIAKKLSFKLAKNHPENIGFYMTLFMVIGMVLIMSMYGNITSGMFKENFVINYLTSIITSFVFALPLQLFIIGPLVRNIFNKLISFRMRTLKEA